MLLANEILGRKVQRFRRISQLETARRAIAVNNTGNRENLNGRNREVARHHRECVTRQLRFKPGHDRRDVAYEVAPCVLSRMRSIGIKVVPESPPWPTADR